MKLCYENGYIKLDNNKLFCNRYLTHNNENINYIYEIAVTTESTDHETELLDSFKKWSNSIKNRNLEYIISLDNTLSSVDITQSIQDQIDEAYKLGYTRVTFPLNAEIEVIDSCDGVSPISNYMPTFFSLKSNTVYDLNGATIKVKTNNYVGYRVFSLQLLDRTILKNGNIIGDKETHLYEGTSTHEWGHGIVFYGSKKSKIENLNISNMTGDGCSIVGIRSNYSLNIPQSDMTEGIIDNSTGENIDGDGYRLTKFINLSFLLNNNNNELSLNNKLILFPANSSGYGSVGQFIKKEVSVLFYDESYTFLSAIDYMILNPISIPKGACYIKYYFPNTDMSLMTDQSMILKICELSEECYVNSCDIGNCRRQGCTVAMSINSGIINSIIHDIKGTSPQCCIDIEQGGDTTQSIIINNNIFKDSLCGVSCHDGNYHIINNNYFYNLKYPLGVVYSSGVRINNCTIIGGIIQFNATNINTSSPSQNLVINNVNIINAKQLIIKGTIYLNAGSMKNVKYLYISEGAYIENSIFLQEYATLKNHTIDNSKIYNCKFINNDNIYLINVKDSIINQIEILKGTLLLAGKTTIKNSIVNQFKFLSSYNLDSTLLFYNCILGIIDNPWKVTSTPVYNIDIKFKNCIITQQTKSIYGIIPLYDNTTLDFENSKIIDLKNNNLHYSIGLTGSVKYKNCIIEGQIGAKFYNNSDIGGIYLIDSKIINFTRPDITDYKIIDEDCEWRDKL